jgi:hypothetical protein
MLDLASSTKGRPHPSGLPETSPAVLEVADRGWDADPIVRGGVVLAVVAAVVQTVAYLTNAYLFDYGVQNLDADSDGNTFTWASTVTTFTAAQCAVVLGLLVPPQRRAMLVLGGILAFLSLDDVARLHEHAGIQITETLGVDRHVSKLAWPALMFPLMLVAAVLLVRTARASGGAAGRTLLAGLALLVAAIAAEVASAPISNEIGESPIMLYVAEVAFEEAAELAGWILIATGLCALTWRMLASRPSV